MIRRILIADSESWASERLGAIAARFRFDVITVDNGIDASERFTTDAPHVVIADAMLPKTSGLAICSRVRAVGEGRSLPFIITSALPPRDDDQLKLMQRESGFTTLLSKPFDDDQAEAALVPFLTDEPDRLARVDGLAPTLVSPGNAIGQIKERFLGEYLLELMRDLRTGILTVRFGGVSKVVVFDRGEIVHVRSNSARDDLARVMLIAGMLSPADLEDVRAYQMAKRERDFVAAVVGKGLLDVDGIRRAVLAQMSQILLDLLPLTQVELSFRPLAHPPTDIERPGHIDAPNLVLWGMRRFDESAHFEIRLPATDSLLVRRQVREQFQASLRMSPMEEQVLSLADGRRRLGDVVSLVRLGTNMARVLVCLIANGLLETRIPVESPTQAEPSVAEPEGGVLAQAVDVFVKLAGRRATGCLRLVRNDEWRQVFLEHGEIVWANSNLEEHLLGRVLLEMGAVAESDLKKALLLQAEATGAKLAGILFQSGSLTLAELERGRRAQIQRIVVDALAWDGGSWQFDPGPSASQERVTLTVPTAELIFESLMQLAPPSSLQDLLTASDVVLMTDWEVDRIESELSLSRSEKLILEVLEAGQTGEELSAFGFMSHAELERVVHGFLALGVVRAVQGRAVEHTPTPVPDEDSDSFDLVHELDGDEPLLADRDEDSAIIRLGSTHQWTNKVEQLEKQIEALKAERSRLSQRTERLEAALDRRGSRRTDLSDTSNRR